MQAGAAEASVRQRPQQRAWWAELGRVVPRAVAGARQAARPTAGGDCPPLSANPLAWMTLTVDELTMSTAYLLSRRGGPPEDTRAEAREAVETLAAAGLVDDPARIFPAPSAPVRTGPAATATRRPTPTCCAKVTGTVRGSWFCTGIAWVSHATCACSAALD